MSEGATIYVRALRQSAALLVVALIPALLAAAFHPRRPSWLPTPADQAEVTLAEIATWGAPALWVDARDAAAYAKQHVPGALALDEAHWESDLPAFIKAWQPGMKVVVYCDDRACGASQAVAQRLRRELGIGQVYVLKGGWSAWRAAQEQRRK